VSNRLRNKISPKHSPFAYNNDSRRSYCKTPSYSTFKSEGKDIKSILKRLSQIAKNQTLDVVSITF
jgi:hypothetical protein